jgi:hypothetical protein
MKFKIGDIVAPKDKGVWGNALYRCGNYVEPKEITRLIYLTPFIGEAKHKSLFNTHDDLFDIVYVIL